MLSSCRSPDSMAFAIKKLHSTFKPNVKFGQSLKNRPYCTHCHQPGHSLETCFKAGNAETPTCTHCHMSGHVAKKNATSFMVTPLGTSFSVKENYLPHSPTLLLLVKSKTWVQELVWRSSISNCSIYYNHKGLQWCLHPPPTQLRQIFIPLLMQQKHQQCLVIPHNVQFSFQKP